MLNPMYCFFIYKRIYFMASLWQIQVSSITSLALWGHLSTKHCDTVTVDPRWLLSDHGLVLCTGWSVDKGIVDVLGRMEQSGMRFHHTIQTACNLKHVNFISGILHLIFSNHTWPWLTNHTEAKLRVSGDYIFTCCISLKGPVKNGHRDLQTPPCAYVFLHVCKMTQLVFKGNKGE